jgi:hypothetical protein
MMRRLLLLSLVACGTKGKGVDIEVVPPSGTAEVELLVAPEACSDASGSACALGIGWPMLNVPQVPPGTIYSLDNDTRNVIPVTRDGQTVSFRLEPGDTSQVERLVVIAFDGGGNASAFGLLDHVTIPITPQIWKVALEAIIPIGSTLGPPTNGATDLVQVWRAPARPGGGTEDPATFASCFARQTWEPELMMWNRELLAPTRDPDCDNEVTECNPYWYDYATGTGGAACLTATSSYAPACVIGGSSCADGQSSSTSCMLATGNLNAVCVPDALCACGDPGRLGLCVRGLVDAGFTTTGSGAPTFADCSGFPTVSATAGPCTSNSANVMSFQLPVANAAHISIGLLSVPFSMPLVTDQGMFPVGTAGFSLQSDPAIGMVRLTWETGNAPLKAPDLVIDVAFPLHHILIPLEITFLSGMQCPPTTMQKIDCPLRGKGSADNEFRCAS